MQPTNEAKPQDKPKRAAQPCEVRGNCPHPGEIVRRGRHFCADCASMLDGKLSRADRGEAEEEEIVARFAKVRE